MYIYTHTHACICLEIFLQEFVYNMLSFRRDTYMPATNSRIYSTSKKTHVFDHTRRSVFAHAHI